MCLTAAGYEKAFIFQAVDELTVIVIIPFLHGIRMGILIQDDEIDIGQSIELCRVGGGSPRHLCRCDITQPGYLNLIADDIKQVDGDEYHRHYVEHLSGNAKIPFCPSDEIDAVAANKQHAGKQISVFGYKHAYSI